MSTAIAVEVISAINTLLQFARANNISSRRILDEYLIARAEGREFTQADVEGLKRQAREALDRLNTATSNR